MKRYFHAPLPDTESTAAQRGDLGQRLTASAKDLGKAELSPSFSKTS
jgi:hypothetical protein